MTILELQKELQLMYEKYGDVEVVVEDTDWNGTDIYHYSIFEVKGAKDYDNTIVTLSNK